MKSSRRVFLGLLSLALMIASCVGESPTDARQSALVDLPISAALIPSPADASALPVNLIRSVVARASDDVALVASAAEVDPNASSWELMIEVPLFSSSVDVVVFLRLMNVAGDGTESLQFSGRTPVMTLESGTTAEPADVDIVRGPLDNLDVTGVQITSAPAIMLEGQTAPLAADVTTAGSAEPQVFWTSLDPAIATVGNGTVTGVAPGAVDIVASAGAFADTTLVEVFPAPTAVLIDPSSVTVAGPGPQQMFSAYVIDMRGDTLFGEAVTWSTTTPQVLNSLGGGLFEAIGAGNGVVQAQSNSDPSVIGTASFIVDPIPVDIDLSKSVAPDTVAVGNVTTFTVIVTNLAAIPVGGLAVLDSLPNGLTIVDATAGSGTFDPQTGLWALDTLAAGASATLSMTTEIDPGTEGSSIQNVANLVIPPGYVDPDLGNNRSTATVHVPGQQPASADIALTVNVDRPNPSVGETVRFTIDVANVGPDDATNLVIDNQLPGALTPTGTPSQGTYNPATGLWTVGDLAAASGAQLLIDVDVPAGTEGQTFDDNASVSQLDQSDPNGGNNSDIASFTVAGAPAVDVQVLKTIDVPQPPEGTQVSFTVSVVNAGPGAVTNLVVFDTLPAAFVNATRTPSVGTLVGDTIWNIPTMAENDTVTLVTNATVAGGVAGGSATNQAELLSLAQQDSTPANDQASVSVSFPFDNVPVVTISSPNDGDVFDPGDPVNFIGSASDVEEGDLSPNLQWTSNRDGDIGAGRTFTLTNLTPGIHEIVASATDGPGNTGADTLDITIALITTPTTLNVPFGGTASLPISLSAPAPAGGLDLTVSSADPAVTIPDVGNLMIPQGGLSANATLQGLTPGTTDVTVASVGFGSSTTSVSVTANLNIVQTSLTVPETFPQPINFQLESAGSPIAAPAGGLDVTLTSANPACLSAPASVVIPAGLVSETATLSYGGSATLPCTAYIRVSSPSVTPDSLNVTVTASPGISLGGTTVGSGLQYGNFQAVLGATQHGGVTVRIESPTPQSVLISPNATTAGAPFIDVVVPNGQNRANYYVQGVEGVTLDTVPITVAAPGFTGNSANVIVVPPSFDISGLSLTGNTFSADDPFQVRTGVPNGQLTALSIEQAIRIGGNTLTATVTSQTATVGELITLPDSVSPVTVDIVPGAARSPSTVAAGGVAFDALGDGSSVVTATIPNLTGTNNATRTVTISAPAISLSGTTVGSGLQYGNFQAVLGATQHGGVTVRIESPTPEAVLISPNATTAGTPFIDVVVPNGQNRANYYVQGVEGVTLDTVPITVAAPGFTGNSANVIVVPPSFDISGLSLTGNTFSADDPFQVRTGVPNGQLTALSIEQAIRIGGNTLTATVTSQTATVGELITLPDSVSPVTVDIVPGAARSPSTVAAGGVAFDALGDGSSVVTATIPNLTGTNNATRTVTISAPAISLSGTTVGSGLQYGNFQAVLGATQHGGVTVRIESPTPEAVLISPNATTAGTPFIDVVVPNGQNRANYYVQGVEGVTLDTVPITVAAPGFTGNSANVIVVPPSFDISGLSLTGNTFSVDDPFQVRTGVPNGQLTALSIEQAIRFGGNALTATVTSSDTGVGTLTTSAGSAGTRTVDIVPGAARSPSTVAAGGVAFDALGGGSTVVTATIPNVTGTDNATRTVAISAPGITASNTTVGSGLQYGNFQTVLGATQHGGVTVRIESSNPSVMLISPNATTAGTPFIDVVVPNGQNRANYYVQGVEAAVGTVVLTASAQGFTDGTASITVVAPALDVLSLSLSQSAAGADDPFLVRMGVPNAQQTGLSIEQAVRAGGTTLTATVTSTDVGVGGLTTSAEATVASVTVDIAPLSARSPGTVLAGGVAFDPVAVGTTTIEATIPGVITTSNGVRIVTVNP